MTPCSCSPAIGADVPPVANRLEVAGVNTSWRSGRACRVRGHHCGELTLADFDRVEHLPAAEQSEQGQGEVAAPVGELG